ncbi:MAG TPA: ROK family protein [Ktedonobacterales bacterium]|nr:ROK family protein [Ktedonobacterales bacterium]
MTERIWAGIEGGGTKFVCLLGVGPDDVLAVGSFPTTTPEETLGAVTRFITTHLDGRALVAAGAACFGPIDLDVRSPGYGSITNTPKAGWSNVNVVGVLRERLGVPVRWETDVNGAALAEQRWGAARGLRSAVYFTVGTGIGGGAVIDGRPLHGLLHPEMGHLPVVVTPDAAGAGVCPFHGGACLEGVASGPAIQARAGRPAERIPPEDPIWEEEARYLAFAAATVTYTLSPQRIIFGGGVLKQDHLLPRIRQQFQALVNGYVRSPTVTDALEQYIAPPQLGDRAGALGALALALDPDLAE